MKNLIRTTALLLCTGMAFAQSNRAQTSVGQPTDTNEPVYKGCLTGTKNNYLLTTEDGRSYRLHSDKDIDDHLNKRVEIRGTMKKEGVDRSASATQQMAEIDVADLKSAGGDCSSPNMAAGSSQGMSARTNQTSQGTMTAQGTTPTGTAATGTTTTAAGATGTANTNVPCNTVAVPNQNTTTQAQAGTTPTGANTTAAGSTNTTAATGSTNVGGSTSSSNTSALPQGDQPQTDVGGTVDSNEPLFTGCLTGKKGKYTLKATNGDNYRLHSDKDINEHVGNRVEIRGTLKPEGDNKARAGSMWKGELDVADIKTVEAGACKK